MYLENSLKIKKCLRIKCYLTSVIIEDDAKYQTFFQILNCSFFRSIDILIHFHINVGIMVIFQKLVNVGPCLFQILEYFALHTAHMNETFRIWVETSTRNILFMPTNMHTNVPRNFLTFISKNAMAWIEISYW